MVPSPSHLSSQRGHGSLPGRPRPTGRRLRRYGAGSGRQREASALGGRRLWRVTGVWPDRGHPGMGPMGPSLRISLGSFLGKFFWGIFMHIIGDFMGFSWNFHGYHWGFSRDLMGFYFDFTRIYQGIEWELTLNNGDGGWGLHYQYYQILRDMNQQLGIFGYIVIQLVSSSHIPNLLRFAGMAYLAR